MNANRSVDRPEMIVYGVSGDIQLPCYRFVVHACDSKPHDPPLPLRKPRIGLCAIRRRQNPQEQLMEDGRDDFELLHERARRLVSHAGETQITAGVTVT